MEYVRRRLFWRRAIGRLSAFCPQAIARISFEREKPAKFELAAYADCLLSAGLFFGQGLIRTARWKKKLIRTTQFIVRFGGISHGNKKTDPHSP